eukprot:CAMPEP_0170359186 /NCGR_PEP_ID=MMETSP0117_2-20130122/2622_1 /TAXON_ID=400756 /ORGANISM="Durinskia baltica, Strain CSIRO CS-38" /LENGTH=212 /DNA_ID=CAMNT_0010613435 /DNA_START=101 /DNA_END=740 /DNA_ORIENTATION=-
MTDSDAGSIAGSRYADEHVGPTGEDFPTWVRDEDAKYCFNCDIKFSMTERRHHCRRCRNVFCTGCSAHKSAIISYGLEEDVKVCEACKTELQTENFYLRIQKPILVRGENFKRYRMMGISSYIVKLRLQVIKSYAFEADSITTLKTWTEALNLAVRLAKELPIRLRVEDDRRKKVENRRRDKQDRQQAKIAQATKAKRTEALTSIKERYSKK